MEISIRKISLGLSLFGIYAISFTFPQFPFFIYLREILAFIILLFFIPFCLLTFWKANTLTFLEKVIASIAVYFVVFTPFFLFLNKIGLSLTASHIFFITFVLFVLSSFQKQRQVIFIFSRPQVIQWIKENYPLLITLSMFVFLHTTNFYFYHYIPEGDGYLDMVRIDRTIDSGYVSTSYRSLFNTSMSIIACFGNISSYRLFSFWIILLESSLVISLYLFIKKYIVAC